MNALAAEAHAPTIAARARQAWEFIVGRTPTQELPLRVKRTIAENQRQSEILVCLVQFAAIATFALLYSVSPKAFPATVPFEPVPWMLALYALFTASRLVLALRDRLTGGLLAASVVVDIAVLMITIWSFHLQYGAPPALYLKAPTLMYVFILIVLRAMRFEARHVLLAGFSAGIGWLALVLYALLFTDGMQITHSYAEYTTSHAILLGAEVDKAISLTAVTLVLAVVISRARGMLVAAATEGHAASELSRFFAPEVAGAIRQTDAELRPGEGVVREAAVLMTDLRGFTHLAAELPPNVTIAVLSEYQDRLVPVIQSNGGAIDKYMGDGIMATFGATRANDTYAADALRALEGVLREGERFSASLEARGLPAVRIGAAVATGPLLYGVVGHESRLEFTVIGDAVNLAAKLEKHTKAAGVPALATAVAVTRARAQGYRPVTLNEARSAQSVAGAAEPLDLVAFS